MALCPFCFAEKDSRAPVCPACNRDTAIPSELLQERDELLGKRDQLLRDLAAKEARLGKKR